MASHYLNKPVSYGVALVIELVSLSLCQSVCHSVGSHSVMHSGFQQWLAQSIKNKKLKPVKKIGGLFQKITDFEIIWFACIS